MIVYHGSDHVIEKPEYKGGKAHNDYGRGFYMTESEELAKEWACGKGTDGYANCYELDIDDLEILELNGENYNILNWLAVLTKYRTYWQNGSVSQQAKEYLQENFFVNPEGYDIIRGYRADDSYFTFAQDFVSGTISLRKLKSAMHLGDLGMQIVLKSPKAFNRLKFIEALPASAEIYYEKRVERDRQARQAYRQSKASENSVNDLYIIDIMREEMKNGDSRLQ